MNQRTIRFRQISAVLVGLATAVTLPALVWPAAAHTDRIVGETSRSLAPSGMLQLAQAGTPLEIVMLPNKPPQRSGERDPSSQALIETWLGSYGWDKDKRFDRERYEIVSRRVVRGEFGRALLQFRVLPVDGDAMNL